MRLVLNVWCQTPNVRMDHIEFFGNGGKTSTNNMLPYARTTTTSSANDRTRDYQLTL